jgi:glucose-1-phosphate thymidylyltransferase
MTTTMKGIILAGGSASRLRPTTGVISKQLLPVYNKPMIYYPMSTLMLAGIRDILLISTPADLPLFRRMLGSGEHLGLSIDYAEQAAPNGLAEAFLLGADHIGDDPVALILGDNLFHGSSFSDLLRGCVADIVEGDTGCTLFGYPVPDPERYGIVELDEDGRIAAIREKPRSPRGNLAATGLYMYDNTVVDVARSVRPSARGELEITDVNNVYVRQGRAQLAHLGRGFTWLDAGTHDSLLQAGSYVQVMESRQGIRISCIEEIALRMGYIDADSCYELGVRQSASEYGQYVMSVATDEQARSATLLRSRLAG